MTEDEPEIEVGEVRPITSREFIGMLAKQAEAGNALVAAGAVEDTLVRGYFYTLRYLYRIQRQHEFSVGRVRSAASRQRSTSHTSSDL